MAESTSDLLKKNRKSPFGLIIGILVLLIIASFFLLLEREKPQITVLDDVSLIGPEFSFRFAAKDKRSGLKSISLQFIQTKKNIIKGPQSKKAQVLKRDFPRQGYILNAGPKTVEETVTANVEELGFTDGEGVLRFTVQDFSFWNWMAGNETITEIPVIIDTTPPRVTVVDTPRYIRPGGSAVVVYKINESAKTHGVTINGIFYPGHPLNSGNDNQYVSYIGLAHDTKTLSKAVISATDHVGNQGRTAFGMNLTKAKRRAPRSIQVSDNFLNQKLPEFSENYPLPEGPPYKQYVYINTEIRHANNAKIKEICSASSSTRLWKGAFKRMPRSMKMAHFADYRNYFYQGQKIDTQYHLGVDLASTSRDTIRAANSGTVVFADYLGIYGNTVIIDHGRGVYSLYAHMSQITIEPDTVVTKESILGASGTTGMAGGDHLHFSMLINGVFVSPLDWWDTSWLKLHILGPLGVK